MTNTRFPSAATILVTLFCMSPGASAPARAADGDRPIRALFVAGGCCHDYLHQKDILTQGISARTNVVWTIAYDPDKSTTHLNPVYDKPDWAKTFDVVVHDECSAGVKDLAIIDRILKPHREGLPAVVLHCGMHSYRSEGFPKAVTPWFEFTGLQSTGHGPQQPIAVTYTDPASPITATLSDWTTINEEHYNNIAGKLLDTGHVLARGTQTFKDKKRASRSPTTTWWSGPTSTTARPRCSPPPWATTTSPAAIPGISIWSPAACCGRSASSTTPT